MNASRDDFIAQMTALLEQQQSGGDFDAPRPLSASEVGAKFNYDYPVLSADDLSVLVDELCISGSEVSLLLDFPLRLNAKLLDNLVYLSTANRAVEATGAADKDTIRYEDKMKPLLTKFIVVLFTATPAILLHAPQATLETILTENSNIDIEEEGVSDLPIEDVSMGASDGSWAALFVRFKHFLSFATVSLLCGPTAHDAVYTRELLVKSHTIDHLGSMLTTLGSVLAQCNANSDKTSSNDKSLVSFFDQSNGRHTERPSTLAQALTQRARFCQSHPYIYTTSMGEENGVHFLSEVKTLWMHLLFLLRDLIIQYPDLCPVWLSTILHHVTSDGSDTTAFTGSTSKEYPDHVECLLVLLCSNIAMSLGSSTALLATQIHHASSSAAFDHKLKAGEVAKNNARKFFRSLLNNDTLEKEKEKVVGTVTFTLSQFVDIVSRMASHSQDNGHEACALLLDLLSLYIEPIDMFPLSDDGKAYGGRTNVLVNNLLSLQEPILQSRALAVILELWSALVSQDSNETVRIANMLTLLCVQNVSISSYLLRWPSIMDTITSMVSAQSSAHIIPLALILAIRAETSDVVLERKQHLLSLFQTSISHVHSQLQATTTTTTPTSTTTAISESTESEAESTTRDHQDAEVRESQATKAGIRGISGLNSTMHLLSAPGSGLPHALQYLSEAAKKENSSFTLLSLHGQLRDLNEAVMTASSTHGQTGEAGNEPSGADSLRKTCKAISSYLEGARGSKTD